MHLRRIPLPGLFGCLLAAGACISCGGDDGGAGAAASYASPPTVVESAITDSRALENLFEAVGTLDAGESITVVSEIDGLLMQVPFEEGGYVQKGDLIAVIDDAQLAAELDRAEAILSQSRATYERVKNVVELGAGARQDLDDADASLKVAEANVAFARARLEKTRIQAAFSGLLGARRVSPGAFLRAGTPVTDLAQIDELRVAFSVPERYLGKLQRGSEVTVSTTAYPGIEVRGKINVVEPILDATTRSARVVAHISNPGRRFRPGMSCNVSAVLERREDALTIPSEAVFVEGDQAFVYAINPDSTVARTPVTLGLRLPDVVEIIRGLEEGTMVVMAGHQKLFEGARVAPVSSQKEP
jgi:membrane fusion protein (multidrug efflux system)